ncbi:MAG TPA: fatty acid--CoA ligase [Candidatus Nanopelagicales bacterium]|jgi:fatty-acyl-CoA synthase
MKSTMQHVPLAISRLLNQGSRFHATSTVVTWTGDGTRTLTYAQVGARSAQLAHALRGLGVDADQRVATFMFNNNEHLEAYLAVPSMGAVLHTLNIRLFPEQVSYIATHAEDHVVIVDGALVPVLSKILPDMPTVRHVIVTGGADGTVLKRPGVEVHAYEELLAAQPTEFKWPEIDEDDAAALCYTSGTTGNPKGVAYSHRSIWLHSMQVCTAEAFGFGPADKVLAVVPQFHAMSWGLPYAAFMSGASLVMPDRFLQAEPLVRMIEQERPTLAGAVPTIWADLLRYLDDHGGDISSLREVVVGGSAVPPTLMRAFLDRYGLRIVHAWGMTETSPLGSVARPPGGLDEQSEWEYRISQGRLPASVEGRLVGPGGEVLAHDGVSVGELEVRGNWVTGSYLHDPAPEKFDDGWLRTGDVGSLTPDGFLHLTDRAKDVIKSGGEWISSVELENHLMAHPDVVEASVVGVPDDHWGERPLATVVLRDGATADPAALREFLAARVARWQLPERWAIIEEVPKTSVGKFDKKALRASYAAGELDVTSLA